jgi:hypothetical protein
MDSAQLCGRKKKDFYTIFYGNQERKILVIRVINIHFGELCSVRRVQHGAPKTVSKSSEGK